MIATLDFYSTPACLSAGTSPFLYPKAPSSLHTVERVRVTEDLDQTVTVPTWDGWSKCNICRISSGDYMRWYWITDITRATDSGASIRLALSVCSTMELVSDPIVGTRMLGTWTRLPYVSDYSPGFDFAGGQERLSATLATLKTLDGWTSYSYKSPTVWAQVTYKKATYDPDLGDTETKGIHRLGFFCAATDSRDARLVFSRAYNSAKSMPYPLLRDVMADPYKTLGVLAEDIIDISVIPYSPYKLLTPHDHGVEGVFTLLSYAGDEVYPTVRGKTTPMIGGLPVDAYAYTLDDIDATALAPASWDMSPAKALNSCQRLCGSVRIMHPDGSMLATLNRSETPFLGSKAPAIKAEVIGDTSGLCLRIWMSDLGTIALMRGIRVPYLGTAWDTYRAGAQALDREAMEYSLSSQRSALEISKTQAVAGLALSAATGGITSISGAASAIGSTAVSFWAQDRQRELSEDAARFSQAISEKRVQATAPTAYATSGGLGDIAPWSWHAAVRLVWYAPPGTTVSAFWDYIAAWGCPANTVEEEVPIIEGYYQGALSPGQGPPGLLGERLAQVLHRGVRLVKMANRE